MNSWKRLAKHAVNMGASLTIELARDSRLHRLKYVQNFTARHRMVLRTVSGCVFGLKSIAKSTLGRPLCKAWGIWTNHEGLALALDGPHVHCPGGHARVRVEGQNTAHSGAYPDNLALFVNKALTSTVSSIRKMVDERARVTSGSAGDKN